jgi:hypothetical protein
MFWLLSRLVCYFFSSFVVYIFSLDLSLHHLVSCFSFILSFLLLPSFVLFLPSVFLYRFAFPPSQPNPFLFSPFLCVFPFDFFCLPPFYLFSISFFLALSPTLLSTLFTYSLSYFVALLRHLD